MNIRLTHIDGKLPNLALMKLAHWHKSLGDNITFSRKIYKEMFESDYDIVYGSVIFQFSKERLDEFMKQWPSATIGGTGSGNWLTVEEMIGKEYEHYDYSIYPEYQWSLGFTQRGCRLSCKFCVVPKKEGKPRSVNTIADIWREGAPKCVCLLDNDFFGQEQWRERIQELNTGKFKVCLNQGINVRMITDESAEAIASIKYYDDQFKHRRLYTAWDNFRDEQVFFEGVNKLEKAGIKPHHIMAYMLIGYDPTETWQRIFQRYRAMKERGILPYPMVYDNKRKDLKRFQKWVVMRYDEIISWEEFRT